jgi:predicted metal-dependent peptidase
VALTPPGFEHQPNEVLTEYDLTHDGKPDVWKYTVKDATGKEVLLRKEKDLNGDGKVDTWEKYNPDGSLARVVYDLDFDGKPDVTLYYERDQLVRKEMAFGFDGLPRAWNYYEKGKLVRKERDTNNDGQVDYWEYWENGEIDRIGVDVDGDGQVDRWEAKKSATAPAEPGATPAPAAQK